MRKKSEHPHDGKSLKTFFFYAVTVLLVVAISLTLKAIVIFQQSKFTGEHFTLALAQEERVTEIVVFNPEDSSLSILNFQDSIVPISELPRQVGVSPDGQITVKNNFSDLLKEDVSETLFNLGLRYPSIKTNMTIFDIGRLSFYAKNLPPNKISMRDITVGDLKDNPQLERTMISFFSDNVVATENISIQVINASGVSGMAQRLERVLLHKGANVVAITGAQQTQMRSQIKYYGEETYTLSKITKMLGFPVSKLSNETIAKIVIVIGEDNKNTTLF